MAGRLDGKIALVTGGSRGIGRAIAVRLAADGCAVVAFSYHSDGDSARSAAAAIEAAGAVAVPVQARLEDEDGAGALFTALDAELRGRTGDVGFDILVNNAGSAAPATLASADPATFDQLVAVNARAPYFITQAAAGRLRDGGRVINISSVYSTRPLAQAPVYSMTKAAVDVLTQTSAAELGERGITVNAVAPGWTATDANAAARADAGLVAGVARDTVAGRIAEPADVAGVVSLFAAPEAAWLTGQYVIANGRYRYS
ncbi:MAG: SDR family oxidoreductase [Actinobacteria bacterium]|nr:SDR family oxidoreductase [Actinomycetota bacterium]